MVTRSIVATLPSLKSSIAHQSLVVSTEIGVMDAIALLSGMTSPEPTAPITSCENNDSPHPTHPPSCLLVQEEGQIIGILTSQDVIRLVVQQIPLENLLIGQVMSHPVITLHESALSDAASIIQIFEQHQIQHLPLLDEQGSLAGLLTYQNLCKALLAHSALPFETCLEGNKPYPIELIPPSPLGIFRTDATGACTSVTQRWCEITGLTPQAAMGEGWCHVLHPEDRDRIATEWYQSIQERRSFQAEGRFQTPEGKVTWFYGQAIEETDHMGQIIGYIGTVTDISDRKQAEELLRQSEERYRSIYDQAAVGFVNATFQGDFVDFNAQFCQMLGYSRQELLQKNVLDITHPDDQPRFTPATNSLFSGDLPYIVQEKRYVRKDGSNLWARTTVFIVRDQAGQVKKSMAVVQDISDRKAAEIALNNVIAGTAATMGRDFFPALVSHIAQALNVDYALISERVDDEVHVLAFWDNGELKSDFSFPVAGTPCEKVIQDDFLYRSDCVQECFPKHFDLKTMEAESYLGIALKNAEGASIGNLCVLDRKAMLNPDQAHTLLTVFADRASAELERQKATLRLEELNTNLEKEVGDRTGALREREARYRALMEGACDAIIVTDDQGKILEVNQKAEQLLGYARQKLTQMHHLQLHPQSEQKAVHSAFVACAQGKQDSMKNVPLVRADGQIILVDISGTTIEIGGDVIVQGIFRDVTERERIKATLEDQKIALQEREKFLATVLDAFPFPIFWKDIKSVYQGGNYHYLQDIGLESGEDLFGKSDYDLPWPRPVAEVYQKHDQEVIDSGLASHKVIHTKLKAEQEPRWFETYKIPLQNFNGETIGVMGMYQDISDRKQAELELQQTNQELARATRLKDEFLANMSHELRTPLNTIQGMTEGLQEQIFGEINERQFETLKTIERSSSHLLELINDILDVAKIEAGQVKLTLSPTVLSSLCESSLAFIKQQAQKKSIQVATQIPPDLPIVMLDARRIRQALINLLSNAVKFTPLKGCITLEVSYESIVERSSTASLAAELTFTVRDNGIGIAPEEMGQLFKPFVQVDSALNRQYQGTGLGLALVKRIAQLHGGDVMLESELGQGSCFTIKLPCEAIDPPTAKQSIQPVAEPALSQLTPPDSLRVLLVEDNPENILTLSTYLDAKGYELCFAKNGYEAITQTQAEQPDIILMDIQMPGMDGLEAIRHIRLDLNLVDIPIIALTALAMKGDRERCIDAGANEYLSKPIKLQQLVNVMQQLLGG